MASVVGLDLGSTAIRAVEVRGRRGSRPVVVRRSEVPMPEGVLEHGDVVAPELLASTVKRMWSTAGFRSKRVVVGVGGQRVLARDLTVPRMPQRRIRESLRYLVQDTLPVPVEDLVLDFYATAEGEGEHGPVLHGLLVAALAESVRANLAGLERAGLSVVGVDLVAFALCRALQRELAGAGAVAIVDMGATTTTVLVAESGVPRFVRVIPTGGDDLTAALVEKLGVDAGRADQAKRAVSPEPGDLPEELREAPGVVRDFERDLLLALRNTLGYFTSTHDGRPVERIVLTGGASRVPGLEDLLARVSGSEVVRADPFRAVRKGRGGADADGDVMAVALGLALEARA